MNSRFEKRLTGESIQNQNSTNSSVDGRFYLKVRDQKRISMSRELPEIPTFLKLPSINQSEPQKVNSTMLHITANVSSSKYPLCGFPPFCSQNASETCYNTTLKDCQQCNMIDAGIFAAIYVIVGCLIIFGNGMVILNVIRKQKGFKDTYSKIRASLAVADILSGLQIFTVVLYNFGWTVGSTAHEIDQAEKALRGSPNAVAGGIFYLLGLTSSLYHLVFLSSQRFYAIALPIRYKLRSTTSIYVGIAIVWTLAVISATFPAWFPDKVTFSYYHTLFVYFPTQIEKTSTILNHTDAPALVSLALFLCLPYILMTGLSIASVAMVRIYYRNRARKLTASQLTKTQATRVSKHEVHILKTIIVMQVGFTISLIPLVTSTALFYAGNLNCENFSTPYFICFYLSLSHSLADVLVYFVLSPKFRASIWLSMYACLPTCCNIKAKNAVVTVDGKNNNNISTSHTRSTHFFNSIELKFRRFSPQNSPGEMKRKFEQHRT